MLDVTIEPENDFEHEIIQVFSEVAELVILRNRKYGSSYRELRQEAKIEKGDVKLPIWLHQREKLKRYMGQEEDNEDPCLDGAGYWGLEEVCRRLDDL